MAEDDSEKDYMRKRSKEEENTEIFPQREEIFESYLYTLLPQEPRLGQRDH